MMTHHCDWPMGAPPAQPGRVTLETGREVYWTGRVAIGLLHQPRRDYEQPVPQSALWIQEQLIGGRKS